MGLGTNGTSNMCGNKSVSPNCIWLKYICHSMALCCETAFDEQPGNLEFLMREIPKRFKRISLRRDDYEYLFSTMNGGESTGAPITMVSNTRWLVRRECLFRILTNWYELNAYFQCIQETKRENRYLDRML